MAHPSLPLRLLATLLFFPFFIANGQALQVSGTSTESVCYNDGSIIATATGGTLPYSFVLTSGPTIAGMVYPFLPTNLVDNFLSIPAGNYTLVCYDNAGDSAQTIVNVAGNYTFPTATDTIINGYSIRVNASGGRPPYTYAISSVASNGPFGPQQPSNKFDTLCNGTYYVRVYDSCQNIFTTLGIIINRPPTDLIRVDCQGLTSTQHFIRSIFNYNTGTPPYKFVDYSGTQSITNTNGTYTVPGFCPDSVVVYDRCGVIDFYNRDCTPLEYPNIRCYDCISHYISLGGVGGQAPYTFRYYTFYWDSLVSTSTNGVFTTLNNDYEHYFEVEDACGRTLRFWTHCLEPVLFTTCPFNNDVEMELWWDWQPPATVTCNTCIPPVTVVTRNFSTVFTGVPEGTHTFTVTDSCGAPIVLTQYVGESQLNVSWDWRSCNDLTMTAFNSFGDDITDSTTFYLYDDFYNLIDSNYTGIFEDMPDGEYIISAVHSDCLSSDWWFEFPNMPYFCMYPTFNYNCTPSYDLKNQQSYYWGGNYDDLPDHLTIESVVPGFSQTESPSGAEDGIYFNDVPVGDYNLVSDSGCSVSLPLGPHPPVLFTAYDSVDCLDNQFIVAKIFPPYIITCGDTIWFRYRVFQNNVKVGENITGNFLVPDTGDYVVAVYYRIKDPVRQYPPLPYTFNDSCFVDSLHIHARPRTLPEIFALDQRVCEIDASTEVPYTIEGGVSPYTMHVPGFGTFAVQGNQGLLSGMNVNNYTLIVYDNCGISNSLTISVEDTCFECGTLSSFVPLDTSVCAGTTITFVDTSNHVQAHFWYVNNMLTYQRDTFNYRFDSAGDYSIMCVAANVSCIDTTYRFIHATTTMQFSLGADRLMCSYDTVDLSAGMNVIWSTGQTGTQIRVTQPGQYSAGTTNNCGLFRDTVVVSPRNWVQPALGPDLALCFSDTILLTPGNGFSSYQWQDGTNDSTFTVIAPGIYSVIVHSDSCILSDTIQITQDVALPFFELGSDTTLCNVVRTVLQTPYTNTLWSTGITNAFIAIDTPGIYWAEVQNNCGMHQDTITIRMESRPSSTLGSDTFTCDGALLTLYAPLLLDSVRWASGDTLSQIQVNATGVYSVVYYKSGCAWGDSLFVQNIQSPMFSIGNDTLYCDNVLRILQSPYTATVWSTGDSGQSIIADSAGMYWARVQNVCGTHSDSVSIMVETMPVSLLVSDTFMCDNASLTLQAPFLLDSVKWSTGDIAFSVQVSVAGVYTMSYYNKGCSWQDTVSVQNILSPSFSLDNDTIYCDEFTRTLRTPYTSTVWSTGETDDEIRVNSAGYYWARVTNVCGTHSDSVQITRVTFPLFTLGNDTVLCDGAHLLLGTPLGVDSLLWFDSTSVSQKDISASGTYWLNYFKQSCNKSDTIAVRTDLTPKLELARDIAECGSSFVLTPGISGVNFYWSDGSTDSVLNVSESGTYSVTVANECGRDSAEVTILLMGNDCRIAIPNAFTPNGDGKNDLFKVKSLCSISSFTLRVYNRWGEVVFESSDPEAGWDGQHNQTPQPVGTYLVYMSYFDKCENAQNQVQTAVTLLH